jgi:hypothetical protein
MNEAMTEMGGKLNQRTSELDRVMKNKSAPNATTLNAFRIITDIAAHDIINFASKIDSETPNFQESFAATIDSLTKLVSVQSQFNGNDKNSIDKTIASAESMIKTLHEVLPIILALRKTIINQPSISAKYNSACQKSLKAVDRLIQQFNKAIRLLQEAQSVFITVKAL